MGYARLSKAAKARHQGSSHLRLRFPRIKDTTAVRLSKLALNQLEQLVDVFLLAAPVVALGQVVGDKRAGGVGRGLRVELLNGGMVLHVFPIKQLVDKAEALVDRNGLAQGFHFRGAALGKSRSAGAGS